MQNNIILVKWNHRQRFISQLQTIPNVAENSTA